MEMHDTAMIISIVNSARNNITTLKPNIDQGAKFPVN